MVAIRQDQLLLGRVMFLLIVKDVIDSLMVWAHIAILATISTHAMYQ
jgi:hypothetical protein